MPSWVRVSALRVWVASRIGLDNLRFATLTQLLKRSPMWVAEGICTGFGGLTVTKTDPGFLIKSFDISNLLDLGCQGLLQLGLQAIP